MSAERYDAVTLSVGYRPGGIGRITEILASYYAEHWGLGVAYEAKTASDLAAFLLRYDPDRDRLWTAIERNRIVGSIAVDGSGAEHDGPQLRWFIVAPDCAGRGTGRRLLDAALAFCRASRQRRVVLSTFAGLDRARRLYEAAGFRLEHEATGNTWGRTMQEQRFGLTL